LKTKFTLLIALVAFSMASFSQKGSPDKTKLKTNIDSISYALGSLIGTDLKGGGFSEINYKIMSAAMERAMKGDSLLMDKMQSNAVLQAAAMIEMNKKSAENNKINSAFLEKNKTAPGVVTTASGLQYKILKAGTGSKPTSDQQVKVHYTGKLLDGKVFDSSVERGEPAVFGVTQVIPGWVEALQLMTVGSKWELYIPSDLAYGPQGNQGIPGNSLLIFEVELLGIE
jgi:FKBP-type peptidyl-prolyl cis-trans isomerase FklB